MGSRWRIASVLVLVAMSGTAGALTESPAGAASRAFDIKECFSSYAWGRIPLRYGNRDFGHRHIERRRGYTPALQRLIRRTLSGYMTYEPQGDHTIVFRRFRRGVTEVVVVGFNLIPQARSGNQIVGIITAYEIRGPMKRRGFPPPNGGDSTDDSICAG